jgi:flagellar motor switch protein FliG
MTTKAANLNRAQKAAAILVAMGKPAAAKLLKFFKQEELKALMEAARSLKTIPQAELEKIVAEFEEEFAEGAGLLDSNEQMKGILGEAMTPEEITALMEGSKPVEVSDAPPPIWPQLEALPSERLVGLISGEHPQTIAMILTNIGPSAAAGAVALLPKHLRGEAVKRMISLGAVPEKARTIVENQLRTRLEDKSAVKDTSAGQARVAGVLNELDKDLLDEVMEDVQAAGAPDLEALRSKLFSFEDIVHLPQRARVSLFDNLPADLVTTSLRGSSAELTEAILSALGARSRRMIEAELKDTTTMPPADEINKARKRIASTAIRLSSEGTIELPNLQAAA